MVWQKGHPHKQMVKLTATKNTSQGNWRSSSTFHDLPSSNPREPQGSLLTGYPIIEMWWWILSLVNTQKNVFFFLFSQLSLSSFSPPPSPSPRSRAPIFACLSLRRYPGCQRLLKRGFRFLSSVSLRPTPKIPAAREKNLWYPGHLGVISTIWEPGTD